MMALNDGKYVKTVKNYKIRPDLKICWFAVTRPGLQEACGSKNFLMLIPEKLFFSHKCMILAMLTLERKVNFLFVLLDHFLAVCVGLTFLTHCPLHRFH